MKSLSNIGYAALVLRIDDPGGTLPDDLKRYEQAVQNLRDKCNELLDYMQRNENSEPRVFDAYLREIKQALVELGEAE